jgi:prepilin peptidase CpaA
VDELAVLATWKQALLMAPLGLCLVICAITDLQHRKVYNKITYPSFILGLLLHFCVLGLPGLIAGAATGFGFIFFGVLLLPLIGGAIGGGDLKLIAVIGAFVGFGATLHVLFYSLLLASVLGLVMATFNGYLWVMLKRIGRFIRSWIYVLAFRTAQVKESLERDERSKLPFAVPTLFGGILAYLDGLKSWPGLYEFFLLNLRP